MQLSEKIQQAVLKAAELIPDSFDTDELIGKEGRDANYVTEYDLKVQTELYRLLREIFPDAAMIGEEDIGEENKVGEHTFIIDPIDGTANFARNMRCSTVCVGYAKDGEIVTGVVYNPYTKEMFSAVKGQGATLNGKKITVADKPLSKAITFVGSAPYYEEMIPKTFKMAEAFLRTGHDIRRGGSAAYDLCRVACGRGDVMFEASLSPWDFGAAGIIVAEAGGVITDMQGKELPPDKKSSVLAASKTAYNDALKLITDILND